MRDSSHNGEERLDRGWTHSEDLCCFGMGKAALPYRPANNIDKVIAESALFQNVVARPSLFKLVCRFGRLFEVGLPRCIRSAEVAVKSSRNPSQTPKPSRKPGL